jgi:hypothetical protein
MFGGAHHNDEVKRIEQSGWSTKKQKEDLGKVLAAQSAAALLHGCLRENQKLTESLLT